MRNIARYLRDFSGRRLERAFPKVQKAIRRRRWNRIARSGGTVLIDVEQLGPKLREGLRTCRDTARKVSATTSSSACSRAQA